MPSGTQVYPFNPLVEPTPTPDSFVPTDISGCQIWLEADGTLWQDSARTIPATADGDPVGAWDDASGNNCHVTQSIAIDRPTLQTNELNGLPVVRFDGSNDRLVNAAGFTQTNPSTKFVIAYRSTTGAANQTLIDGGSDVNKQRIFVNNPNLVMYSGSFGPQLSLTGIEAGFRIVTAVFNGSSSTLQYNGGTPATGNPGTETTNGISVGNHPTGFTSPWQGDIAEVITYNSALSEADRKRVERYLTIKWLGRLPSTQVYPFLSLVEPGGGSTLTVNASDSVAINDPGKNSRQVNERLLSPDQVALSDLVTRLGSYSRLSSDFTAVADAAVRLVGYRRLNSDFVAIGDAATASIRAAFVIAVSDLIGVSDVATRIATSRRVTLDSIGLADAVQKRTQALRLVSDFVGLTDAVQRVTAARRSVADSIAIGDSVSRQVIAPGVLIIAVSDLIAISDTVQRQAISARSLADLLGVSDTANRAVTSNRTVADFAAVSDAVARAGLSLRQIADFVAIGTTAAIILNGAGQLLIQASDSIGWSDSVSRLATSLRLATDGVGLSDLVSRLAASRRLVSDFVGISDAATVRLVAVGTLLIMISDMIGINDRSTAQNTSERFAVLAAVFLAMPGVRGFLAEE